MLVQQLMERISMVLRNQKGQGLVEYALILVLISIVAIATMQLVGAEIITVFTDIITGLTAR